ncbi:MAG: hypothetical protein ACI9UA_001409 [Pseudoalteromonas tetraodonis]|jgi:hypothetical protein
MFTKLKHRVPAILASVTLTVFACAAQAELVAHWPLDDSAEDLVGNHDGAVSGGVVFGAEGAAAHTGSAAEFNGSSSTITVPHSTDLNPASFTLALWANADSTSGFASAVTSRDDTGASVHGYIIYNDSQGRWNFWSGGGGSPGSWPQLPGPAVQVGSWTHLAISYEEATQTMRFYVNGTQANSATAPNLYSPNGPQAEPFNIGSGADNGGSFYFDGLIDDVALWDEALTVAEIQDVMDKGVPGGAPAVTSFSASPPFVDSGQAVTLSWNVVRANSISISPGVGAVANPSGSVVVTPAETTTYTLTAIGDSAPDATTQVTVGVDVEALPPVLNEFVADNRNGLTDPDGEREDWIEIYNPNPFAIDLGGWSLSDDQLRPDKWEFAPQIVPAGGYLIVFASEKSGLLDANFKLAAAGEYLALVDPDGEIVSEFAPAYPAQFDDVAYGIPSGGSATAFLSPTPGTANGQALIDIAPAVTSVTENPPQPTANEPLPIRATVTPRAGAISSVTLTYRVGYGIEQTLAMADTGGGIYAATIPANIYATGDMLRWFVTASTAGGETTREPVFPDATESAEYFGTVIADPIITTNLPVLSWFAQDTANADRRAGTRASVHFKGRFYDNIFCRIRGQSTANWPKHKYKFDFYRGGHFFWRDGAPKVEEFNVNSHYRDGYVRENGIFAFLRQAGSPAPETMYIWIQRNGTDMGLFTFVEQVDEEFLGRHGFDASGAMYKAINVPATLSPTVNTSLYRKALRKNEPYTDLVELTAGINVSNPERFAYVADEVNLPNYINVMAAMAVPLNHDQLTKNYYIYRDPHRNEWFRFPWDGDQGLPTNRTEENWASPLYGDALHTQELRDGAPNPQWQNHLHAAILDNPITREMYMRRLRTLADRYLVIPPAGASTVIVSGEVGATSSFYHVPADSSLDTSWFTPGFDPATAGWASGPFGIGYENSPGDYADLISTRVKPTETAAGATSIYTRSQFEVTDPSKFTSLVLQVKYDDGFVAYLNGTEVTRSNVVGTAAFDSSASSHSDSLAVNFEDFPLPAVSLLAGTNTLAVHAINSSAGSSDMLIIPQLVDRPGSGGGYFETLINGFVAEISTDAARDQSLWSGQNITSLDATVSGILNNSLPNRRTQLFQTYGPNGSGLIPDSEPKEPVVDFGGVEFNPASGDQDEEFIEIVNPNDYAIDLSGWRVGGGIEFTFPPGAVIPADGANPQRAKIFLTPDVAAFRGRTSSPKAGESRLVLGNYSGHLANTGESLTLFDASGRLVTQTSTPVDPSDVQQFLVVSEIMYHPADDGGDTEFIEVMNISDTLTLDLSGVKFTDGIEFEFAPGTMLVSGTRLVISRAQFENGTALSNGGEVIKLEDASNSTVAEFAYDDAAPWPTSPDGGGPSLVLVRPETRPDPGIATNWRPSALSGGNPGGSDTIPLLPGADPLEYALVGEPQITSSDDGLLLFAFYRRLGADDVEITPEWSPDLASWNAGEPALVLLDEQPDGAGNLLVRLQLSPGALGFARLSMSVLPAE